MTTTVPPGVAELTDIMAHADFATSASASVCSPRSRLAAGRSRLLSGGNPEFGPGDPGLPPSHPVVAPVDAAVVLLARGEPEEPEKGSGDEDGSAQTPDGDVGRGGDDGPEQDAAHDPCPQRERGTPRVVAAVHAHEPAGPALGQAGPCPACPCRVACAVRTSLLLARGVLCPFECPLTTERDAPGHSGRVRRCPVGGECGVRCSAAVGRRTRGEADGPPGPASTVPRDQCGSSSRTRPPSPPRASSVSRAPAPTARTRRAGGGRRPRGLPPSLALS